MTTRTSPVPSPEAREPEHAAPVTTLDPAARYVTIVNTYKVAPERAEELLDALVRATDETVRVVPGFVSANLHMSLDRTQVVNYAQWRDEASISNAGADPEVVKRIRAVAQIADSFTPVRYELRKCLAAPHASAP